VQVNVVYDYEWFAYVTIFQIWMNFGLFLISCDYDLFNISNKLIFYDVFVFFITCDKE